MGMNKRIILSALIAALSFASTSVTARMAPQAKPGAVPVEQLARRVNTQKAAAMLAGKKSEHARLVNKKTAQDSKKMTHPRRSPSKKRGLRKHPRRTHRSAHTPAPQA